MMCFSTNAIEKQVYETTETIRDLSIYKFVRADVTGGKSQEFQNGGEHMGLITSVILEDRDGTLYSVEPNANGLKFAKGEITYKEYTRIQKRETVKGLSYFFLGISTIFVMGLAMVKFLI